MRHIILAALLLVAAPIHAQKSLADCWKEVENALPRRGAASLTSATTPQPSAGFDWAKINDRMTEAMINAADTPAEPWATWYLAHFKLEAGEIDEAQNLLVSIQQRFSKHPLNVARLGKNGRTLMQDALDDVAQELAFRAKNPRKPVPLPVLADDMTATLRFSMGDVTVRFYPNVARKHVERFVENCNNGLYDGTRITRVNDNTITAGDPLSKDGLTPDPRGAGRAPNAPSSIAHEFSGLTHRRGIVSMLRNPIGNDSSGVTFCFVMKDFSALDLQQTPFAEVVAGMEVLDAMTRVGRAQGETPASPITLRAISVTKGSPAPTNDDKK